MNEQTLYSIWCEWDFGFDHELFESEIEARDYAKKVIDENQDQIEMTFEEMCEEALIGFQTYTLYKK